MQAPLSPHIRSITLQLVSNKISPEVEKYLRQCGMSERKILNSNSETRLYHDLNIYGDIAETFVEVLESDYSVDLTSFVFDRYFPEEYIGDTALQAFIYQVVPFLGKRKRYTRNFEPIRLSDLEMIIRSKSWSLS